MDQTALRQLSEAFAKVNKPAAAQKKRRRRRRRKRTEAITPEIELYRAQNELAKTLRLKHEAGSAKRLAAKLTVTPIHPDGRTSWRVTGGQCEHVVTKMGGVLCCTDHVPSHAAPVDGFACSHEVAVRRFLVQEVLRRETAA